MAVKSKLESRVEHVLSQLRPFLQKDDGDIELIEITPGKTVRLRFLGSCSYCEMKEQTFKGGIEEAIRSAIPEVKKIEVINLF